MNVRMLMIAALLLLCVALHAQVDHTPTFNTRNMRVDPIMNNNDPEFVVDGIVVTVPGLTRSDSARPCEIRATVTGTDIKDAKTDMTYKAVVVGQPEIRQVPMDLLATMPNIPSPVPYMISTRIRMKVTSGKVPLRPGMVRGTVALQIVAIYADAAGNMHVGKQVVTMAITN